MSSAGETFSIHVMQKHLDLDSVVWSKLQETSPLSHNRNNWTQNMHNQEQKWTWNYRINNNNICKYNKLMNSLSILKYQ